MLGLPPRPRARPAKRLSRKSVERAWQGQEFDTLHAAAASLGVRAHVLRYQAMKVYGLPPRKWVNHATKKPCRWFSEMWGFDVSVQSIAAHMGVKDTTVYRIADRLGLPPRLYDRSRRKLTVADFMRDELPRLLAVRMGEIDRAAYRLRTLGPGQKASKIQIAATMKLIADRRAVA